MKNLLKQLIVKLLKWTGIIKLYQFNRRNELTILTIHGVMDDKDNPVWKPLREQLSRDKLDEYLSVLTKKYNFISLSEAMNMLQGRAAIKPYSVVVTFDDGYRNNFTCALPILRKYNVPAIFFVSTGFINNPRPFWWDRLDYALQQIEAGKRDIKFGNMTFTIDNSDRDKLEKSFRYFRKMIKDINMSDIDFLREIEKLSIQLEKESGKSLIDILDSDEWSAITTWDQIKKIKDVDVIIGSHTVDHIRLGLVEKETAIKQLTSSKKDIETYTGVSCFAISYSNGNLNSETAKYAKECGYKCGVTTKEGFNKIGTDLMKLKRINVPTNMSATEFLLLISGASSILNSVKQFLLYPVKLFGKFRRVTMENIRLFRSHGIKTAIKRFGAELYSNTNYVILRHDLHDYKEFNVEDKGFCIEQLKQNDTYGIEEVCSVWPANWRSKHLKTKVVSDLEKGDLCFVMKSDNNVIGVIWYSLRDGMINRIPDTNCSHDSIVRSGFIIPSMRNKGLFKYLIGGSLNKAKEEGYLRVFGYARQERIASIKTFLRLGFEIPGTLNVTKRAGKATYTFIPETKENNIRKKYVD